MESDDSKHPFAAAATKRGSPQVPMMFPPERLANASTWTRSQPHPWETRLVPNQESHKGDLRQFAHHRYPSLLDSRTNVWSHHPPQRLVSRHVDYGMGKPVRARDWRLSKLAPFRSQAEQHETISRQWDNPTPLKYTPGPAVLQSQRRILQSSKLLPRVIRTSTATGSKMQSMEHPQDTPEAGFRVSPPTVVRRLAPGMEDVCANPSLATTTDGEVDFFYPSNKRLKTGETKERRRYQAQQESDKLEMLCSATLELGPLQEKPATGCSCPRSHCIKLYCDCFKAGLRCNESCSCKDCKNTFAETRVDGERIQAIKNTLLRNPRAFTGGKKEAVPANPGDVVCNCIKSRCLKLYCVCFHNGRICNDACLCVDCLNTTKEGEVGGKRHLAIQACRNKRSDAFEKKEKKIGAGCACKNNRCLKKYWYVGMSFCP